MAELPVLPKKHYSKLSDSDGKLHQEWMILSPRTFQQLLISAMCAFATGMVLAGVMVHFFLIVSTNVDKGILPTHDASSQITFRMDYNSVSAPSGMSAAGLTTAAGIQQPHTAGQPTHTADTASQQHPATTTSSTDTVSATSNQPPGDLSQTPADNTDADGNNADENELGAHYELDFSKDADLVPPESTNRFYFTSLGFLHYLGKSFVSVRRLHFERRESDLAGRNQLVWISHTYVCELDLATMKQHSCQELEVQQLNTCKWLGKYEMVGVEDARLFAWPGKGIYATFGAKPPQQPGQPPWCVKYALSPHIVSVSHPAISAANNPASIPGGSDPWALGTLPVRLVVSNWDSKTISLASNPNERPFFTQAAVRAKLNGQNFAPRQPLDQQQPPAAVTQRQLLTADPPGWADTRPMPTGSNTLNTPVLGMFKADSGQQQKRSPIVEGPHIQLPTDTASQPHYRKLRQNGGNPGDPAPTTPTSLDTTAATGSNDNPTSQLFTPAEVLADLLPMHYGLSLQMHRAHPDKQASHTQRWQNKLTQATAEPAAGGSVATAKSNARLLGSGSNSDSGKSGVAVTPEELEAEIDGTEEDEMEGGSVGSTRQLQSVKRRWKRVMYRRIRRQKQRPREDNLDGEDDADEEEDDEQTLGMPPAPFTDEQGMAPQEVIENFHRRQVKEKNWVPFIHKGALYMSYALQPHVVVQPQPNGTSAVVHITSNPTVFDQLESKVSGKGPHGGTPAILIPAEMSKMPEPFYLGVLHYTSRQKDGFRNFFYKMEAVPPFRIMEVSDDLPLVRRERFLKPHHPVAFPCGLDIIPGNRVVVSYGSGDVSTHLLVLEWDDVVELFEDTEWSPTSSAGSEAGGVPAAGTPTKRAA